MSNAKKRTLAERVKILEDRLKLHTSMDARQGKCINLRHGYFVKTIKEDRNINGEERKAVWSIGSHGGDLLATFEHESDAREYAAWLNGKE